jgi:3-oxoacyl-[acyl-carrier-protein] synthase-3
MATAALSSALAAARLSGPDLDAVIVASVVPEQPMPTTSVLVLRELGLNHRGPEAFDVNASCLGFLTAFEVATLGVAAGRWGTVGVVASDIASKGLNHADIESSSLFGDGAGAAVVTRAPEGSGSRVLAVRFETWSQGADLCEIRAGGARWNVVTPHPDPDAYFFRMDGAGVLKLAARSVPAFLRTVLSEAGCLLDEIDVVVPHQASHVALRFLRERLGVPEEKVVEVLATSGNQVSASLPSALHHAVASGRLRRGDTALLMGTGGGLTIGAAVIEF